MAEVETQTRPGPATGADAAPYVRPDVRAFLDFLNSAGAAPMSSQTPEMARLGFLQLGSVAERAPLVLPVIRDLTRAGPRRRHCAAPVRPARHA